MLRSLLAALLLASPSLNAQVLSLKTSVPVVAGAPGVISFRAPSLNSGLASPLLAAAPAPSISPVLPISVAQPSALPVRGAKAITPLQSAVRTFGDGPFAIAPALSAMFDGAAAVGEPAGPASAAAAPVRDMERIGGELYSTFSQKDLDTAAYAMLGTLNRSIFASVFLDDAVLRRAMLKLHAETPQFKALLATIYLGLRAAYDVDLPAHIRVGTSAALEDHVRRFLLAAESSPLLPKQTRSIAARARERYLDAPGLISGLAWSRQQKAAIAAWRSALQAERFTPDRPAGVRDWSPPAADAAPPAKSSKKILRQSTTLPEIDRQRREREVSFELALNRIKAARKMELSPRTANSEERRWRRSGRSFNRFLSHHEADVDYIADHTLRMEFAQRERENGPIRVPTSAGLSVERRGDLYVLSASFETHIDNPAAVAAFRRSIESYWNGRFSENGSEKRLETRVAVRSLRPDEDFSPASLRLLDGKTTSYAGRDSITLSRKFRFDVPAHEFGHILGLPDEYVDEYRPDEMLILTEQDESSLMASIEGLVLPGHIERVVALLRKAGKIKD